MKQNYRNVATRCGVVFCLILTACFFDAAAVEGPASETLPVLAIAKLDARGITADEAATLTDVLSNELYGTRRFIVMERAQMDQILKEQGFQQSGACSDQSCLVEMGQLLGAQQMVAGSIGLLGKAYAINLRLISIQTGQIISTVSHSYTGPIESLLTSEMAVVARRLAGLPVKSGERTGSLNNVLLYGSIGAGVLVAGGVVTYFVLQNNQKQTPEAEVNVTW